MKGQNNAGGWWYMCPELPEKHQNRLRGALGAAVMKGGKELPQVGAAVDSRPRLDPGNEELLKELENEGLIGKRQGGGFILFGEPPELAPAVADRRQAIRAAGRTVSAPLAVVGDPRSRTG